MRHRVRAFQPRRLDFSVINGRSDSHICGERARGEFTQIKRNDANSILIYRRISRQCQFALQICFAVWYAVEFYSSLSAPNRIYRSSCALVKHTGAYI